MHAALPVTALYFPAAHKVHDGSFGPVVPTGQVVVPVIQLESCVAPDMDVVLPVGQYMHTLSNVAPIVYEYEALRQLVHIALPMIVLYFPAAHCVQLVQSLSNSIVEGVVAVHPAHEPPVEGQSSNHDVTVTGLPTFSVLLANRELLSVTLENFHRAGDGCHSTKRLSDGVQVVS